MNRSLWLAAMSFAIALPSVAGAADSLSTAPRPIITAIRLSSAIDVDGKLDEQAWQSDNAVTSFKQRDPNEGQAASLPTEVRVLYDDDAIYIGARMHDTAPDSILARLTRRWNRERGLGRRDASVPCNALRRALSGVFGPAYEIVWPDESRVTPACVPWLAALRRCRTSPPAA